MKRRMPMCIVRDLSVLHLITGGKFKGRICNIRNYFFTGTSLKEAANVVFADFDLNDFADVRVEFLAKIDSPGWPLTEKEYRERCSSVYGLEEYFKREKGNGSNLLRTNDFAQPRALKIGDVLATGAIVEKLRKGYSDSVIVRLDQAGWAELAPRLPVALQGNEKFKLPADLVLNDKMATGCVISRNSSVAEKGWIHLFLDRENCCIDVPCCMPLALA